MMLGFGVSNACLLACALQTFCALPTAWFGGWTSLGESWEKIFGPPALQIASPAGGNLEFTRGSLAWLSPHGKFVIEQTHGQGAAPRLRYLGAEKQIEYPNAWPGVTLCYRLLPGMVFKSEYLLAPGFTAETLAGIELTYSHAFALSAEGRITFQLDRSVLIESPPIAWQDIQGQRRPVIAWFVPRGPNRLGFAAKGYDPRYPLVIDPALVWNTFLGSAESQVDTAEAINLDNSGNLVVAGTSDGPWGINPVHGYSGDRDIYLAKMDPAGNLVWLTFLGGVAEDKIACITRDGTGNYFVIGSCNAAWGGTIVRPYAANREGFAAKVSASGSILWVSFFGGPSQDSVEAIAFSSASTGLYLAGSSDQTWGSPIQAFQGGTDAFTCQLDSSGSLLWNTFLGGSGTDWGEALALDAGGNAYLAGSSDQTWGSPLRAFQGGTDAFACQMNNSGNLLWNTFLGGTGTDKAAGLTLDSGLNVYIAGSSSSSWGISPIRSFTSGQDAFIARLGGNGNLVWNTFLGGNESDNGVGIALDSSGNVFVAGSSSASWGTNIKRVFSGGNDGFVARLNSAGALQWNSFLGSTVSDTATSLAVNTSGWIAVSGSSSGPWGDPARPYSADSDGYLAIMNALGDLTITSFLGSGSDDTATAMAVATSGECYLAGYSYGPWGNPIRPYCGGSDGWVAKYHTSGSLLWNTFLGAKENDSLQSLVIAANHRLLFAGSAGSTWGSPIAAHRGQADMLAGAMDTSGNLLWHTFLGGTGADSAFSLAADGTGNLYLAGHSNTSWASSPVDAFAGNYDICVAKIDSTAAYAWHGFYGGSASDVGSALLVSSSNEIFVAGISGSSWGAPRRAFSATNDGVVFKLNPGGALQWNTFLGGSSSDICLALAEAPGQSVFAVGGSFSSWETPLQGFSAGQDGFLALLDSAGSLQWHTFFGGAGSDLAVSLVRDSAGTIRVFGQSDAAWGAPLSSFQGASDIFLAFFSSAGDLLGNDFWGGPNNDYAKAMALSSQDKLWMAGFSYQTWGTPINAMGRPSDAFLAIVDVNPLATPTPTPPAFLKSSVELRNSVIRPGMGQQVFLDIALAAPGTVEYWVFSQRGRQIFFSGRLAFAAGSHTITWPSADGAPSLASGPYLLKVKVNGIEHKYKFAVVR